MSALSKIGLIELSEEEKRAIAEREAAARGDTVPDSPEDIDRILQASRELLGDADVPAADDAPPAAGPADPVPPPAPPAAPPAAPPPAAPPPPPPAEGIPAAGLGDEQPLEQIYQAAGVPASPFPAEKMLKVLNGLRAMPVETRKAAILAMDAADDDWTIDDAILDAQRKARALEQARAELGTRLEQAEAAAAAELAAQDEYQEQATAEIRRQIAELEALLQEELSKVAAEKSTIQANLQATREACAREAARYDKVIAELGELSRTFGTS